MLNILIMAGGKGERFWPKSREKMPKQLLNLSGHGAMIQETVWRIKDLVSYEQIYIVTTPVYAPMILQQLPEIPTANIIVEPDGRNTAPCIGLASMIIESRDPQGVTVVLPSDHAIQNEGEFCRILRLAAETAEKTEGIVTLGIAPNRPETGYGYIKQAEAHPTCKGAYRVQRFTEKPNLELAEEFLRQGKYLWNSGMFVWKTQTILGLIKEFMPEMHQGLESIRAALGTEAYDAVCREEYGRFERISIDYGIMERAPFVYVIPSDIGWDDVGSWSAMARLHPADEKGNVATGKTIILDSRDNIIYNPGKMVAVLGIEGLVVVEAEDCILVAPKARDQEIREIINELKRRGWHDYL